MKSGRRASVTDIRTAFLLAPRPKPEGGREVIVVPPKVLGQRKVASAEGTLRFPSREAHWVTHRNQTMNPSAINGRRQPVEDLEKGVSTQGPGR